MQISADLYKKFALLQEILHQYPKIAVAYSGGVDSSLLLKVAFELMPGQVIAFFADSIVQPQGEKEAAIALAGDIGCSLQIVDFDILANPEISANSPQRCYFCKKKIFSKFLSKANKYGCSVLLDGTNLDDNPADRPGAEACLELGVKSPLREAGFSKQDIRLLSRHLVLTNWDKHSASCLATRITTGVEISAEQLALIDRAEQVLHGLGFLGCRVRVDGKKAFVELSQGGIAKVVVGNKLTVIREQFKLFGFKKVYVDLSEREGVF